MNAIHNLNLESFPTVPVSTGKYPYGKDDR